jgi:hypothetical protein
MSEKNAVIAVYRDRAQAEGTLKQLKQSGFDATALSIVGKDNHSAAFFAIPGIGRVVAGGPLVASIVRALEGNIAVGGESVIGAALCNIGIPENCVLEYESAIQSNRFLLLAQGTAEELETAKVVFEAARPVTLSVHSLTRRENLAA